MTGISAPEFMAAHTDAHSFRSRHDELNNAEIERLFTQFAPSIPPSGVTAAPALHREAAGAISL